MASLYDILGAQPETEYEELKCSYQRLILTHHPDKQRQNGNALESSERFRAIHEAWKVLGDKEKRLQYDDTQKNKLKEEDLVAEDVEFSEFEEAEQDDATGDILYTKSCRCGDIYMVRFFTQLQPLFFL
jgi:DnaJ-class molecular chaperone